MIDFLARRFTRTISWFAWGLIGYFAFLGGLLGSRLLFGNADEGSKVMGFLFGGCIGVWIGVEIATIVLGILTVILRMGENLAAIRAKLEQAEPRDSTKPPPLPPPALRKAG